MSRESFEPLTLILIDLGQVVATCIDDGLLDCGKYKVIKQKARRTELKVKSSNQDNPRSNKKNLSVV